MLTEVPNASKAGQKPETKADPDEPEDELEDGKVKATKPKKAAQKKKRRLLAKTSQPKVKATAAKTAKPKAAAKAATYKPCRLDEPLPSGPFSLRWRTSPPMGYVMGPKYVVGLAKSRSSMYAEILQDVCKLLNGKQFSSKRVLYDWVNTACSDDES